MMLKKSAELIVSGVVLLFGIVLFAAAQYIERGAELSLGGDFMPKLCSLVLVILGLLLMISNIISYRSHVHNETGASEEKLNFKAFIINIVILFLYIFLLEPIGFLIMTALYIFVQILMFVPKKKKNYVTISITAVLSSVIIYYLFVDIFELILPAGILG